MPGQPFVYRLNDIVPDKQGRTALYCGTASLTFAGLAEGMTRFAGWLGQSAGVQRGDRVAICLPKCLEAAMAIYGAVAAGACYVPLTFRGQPARLADTLEATEPRLLLTTPREAARLSAISAQRKLPPIVSILPDRYGRGLAKLHCKQASSARPPLIEPDDLAAIYFTSGSTGEPKGVMLSHRGVVATLAGMERRDRMNERDRRISHAGLQHIASLDLFFPLFGGCQVFLLSEAEAMFAERIAEVLEREKPTIWSAQTTAMRMLLDRAKLECRDLRTVRRVACFGEPMPLDVLRHLMTAFPAAQLVNHYGATEAYNMANYFVPRPLPDGMETLPMGEPADHCLLTLRDEEGREVPAGEVGEICVVSETVMQGYWRDPALTAAKRFGGVANSYRTGDLAVRRSDGALHFMGRKDNLIKLRGHRFHLGEIETLLKAHPAVRAAVAFARIEQGGEQSVRAVVLSDRPGLGAALRRLCAERLPAFARPLSITTLAEFPLLASGKVDRRRLQAMVEGE